MMRAVLIKFGIIGIVAGAAAVSEANSLCFWADLKWDEDPLVPEGEGRTAYVTPRMVSRNESGECHVANREAFFEEEAMATEMYEDIAYGKILVFSGDDFLNANAQFATLAEVEAWAMAICGPLTLS